MKEIIKTLIRFSCNVIKLSEIFCKTPRTESSQILVRGVLFFFLPVFHAAWLILVQIFCDCGFDNERLRDACAPAISIHPFQQFRRYAKCPRWIILFVVSPHGYTASFPATANFALAMNASLKSTTSLMTSFSMARIYAAMYSQSGT